MDYLIDAILNLFGIIYDADDRPEARRLTLGCLAVALILAALLIWWFW